LEINNNLLNTQPSPTDSFLSADTPHQTSPEKHDQFSTTVHILHQMPESTPNPMLLHNEQAAPKFNNTKPWKLACFFDNIEQLFTQVDIKSKEEKKKYTVCYVDFNTKQMWKTFPDFNTSYEEFKKAVLVHYPDAVGNFIYSLQDMGILIGEQQWIGIMSSLDLSDYHLQFLTIMTWLIDKEQLGKLEQQQAYIQAFQPRLLSAIMN
jgi:hypothetical protein